MQPQRVWEKQSLFRNKSALVVLSVLLIGTALVVLSFAEEAPPQVSERLVSTQKINDFSEQPMSNNTFTAPTDFYFSTQVPSAWKVFTYKSDDTANPGYITQLRSSDVVFDGKSHSQEYSLTKGQLIEIGVIPSTTTGSIDSYKELLSGVENLATVSAAGKPALQYRLSSEKQDENYRLITTFFANNLQFSVTLSVSSNSPTNTERAIYDQVLQNINVGN